MIRLKFDSKFPETIHLTSLQEMGAAEWKPVFAVCCRESCCGNGVGWGGFFRTNGIPSVRAKRRVAFRAKNKDRKSWQRLKTLRQTHMQTSGSRGNEKPSVSAPRTATALKVFEILPAFHVFSQMSY